MVCVTNIFYRVIFLEKHQNKKTALERFFCFGVSIVPSPNLFPKQITLAFSTPLARPQFSLPPQNQGKQNGRAFGTRIPWFRRNR
jgi:hypothetical protein